METIDVSGIPRAELLVELYNQASPLGLGFLQARAEAMNIGQAQALIDGNEVESDYGGLHPNQDRHPDKPVSFDYLYGRPLKITLNGNELNPWAYDRDQGQGAAQRAVDAVRERLAA